MSSRFFFFNLLIWAVAASPDPACAQEWTWEWGRSITRFGTDAWISLHDVGPDNKLYSTIAYDTLLVLPDTVFHHPEQWGNSCIAFVSHDDRGLFTGAMDLYAPPGHIIHNPLIKTDPGGNIFITANYSNKVFFMDTVVLMCNTPYTNSPDAMCVKLDEDLDIKWIRTIGGTLQDDLREMIVTEDGQVILFSEQMADIYHPTTVSFFGQDTVTADHDFTSVSKLDAEGNMVWRRDFHGEISAYHMSAGANDKIHIWGHCWSDIIYGQDTLFKPYSPVFTAERFFLILDMEGGIDFFEFSGFPLAIHELAVNEAGEYFVSGSLHDTVVLGADTLIIPEGDYHGFIGKFDAGFQPVWYHIITNDDLSAIGMLRFALDDDHIVFETFSDEDIEIADTTLVINYGYEGIWGEFDGSGNLLMLEVSETNYEIRPTNLLLDNCRNILTGGSYRGVSHLGDVTLDSWSNNFMDAFIAKINRTGSGAFDLGPDTVVCNSLVLYGPEGYDVYQWNGQQTNDPIFEVTELGYFDLKYGSDGCWGYDTIFVNVHHADTIELGPDTAILITDTLTLEVAGQFSSFLWSDGSTGSSITVTGSDLGLGTHAIWVMGKDQVCEVFDTVIVEVKDAFGVAEKGTPQVNVFPNPFHDRLYLRANGEVDRIEICSIEGIIFSLTRTRGGETEAIPLPVEGLIPGIYFLHVYAGDAMRVIKLVRY